MHEGKSHKGLHPVLEEFKQLVETNTRVYMLITSMFQEVPKKKPYVKDAARTHPQIHDYHHMLQALNRLLTSAPSRDDKSHRVRLVGLPVNDVWYWPMGTPSGYAAFLDPEINAMLKKVLNAWGEYLVSPESASVLDNSPSGWFGEAGIKDLTTAANVGSTSYTFDQVFECEPAAKYHGFKSWDDFFTRRFREGVRPVASPEDHNVIANACESQPYNIARNVKARDKFWAKGQPYSVLDMLGHDVLATQFVGGTVYQAFLSALSYHRWHSPVSGKISKAYVIDGTYYSEPLYVGIADSGVSHTQNIDAAGGYTTQGYITATATRALIFIEADNPAIGLMVFIGVGMADVSTCQITVKEGQHVEKGGEIGMFHFGGSTHCLLFREGVNVTGFPEPLNPGFYQNVPVRSRLAMVS